MDCRAAEQVMGKVGWAEGVKGDGERYLQGITHLGAWLSLDPGRS